MKTSHDKSDDSRYAGNQFLKDDESRFFLASIVDSLQDSIVSINLHGIITSWNKGAEHVYGYSASEVIGKSLDLIVIPEDFVALLKNIEKIRAGEQIDLFHTVRIHRDGRHMNMDITLSPVKNASGEVIGISTVARDVTAIHQIQAALRVSEGRLRAIIDAAVDFGIIILDNTGSIIDWNKGAEMLFGYTKAEVLGNDSSLLFTPEDRHADIARSELERARSKGRAIDERWHLHKNGSRFFMSGVMTPIHYDTITGFVKIARNITDRKLAEEALMQSEQRKLLAVKSAEMGEWEWQLSTRLVRISEQVTLLFGFETHSPEITPEQLFQQIYPADQKLVREQVIAASNGLQILQTECRIVRADNGQVRWVNVYGRVVMQTDNRPAKLIGVFYDITQRKTLEKQKDDFISVASHELKTPVTAINSYAELLAESLEAGGNSYHVNLANKLSEQVNRLTELIRNLLDTSQLSEGAFKLSLQPTDIKELILEQREELEHIGRNHRFTWHLKAVPLLQADRKRIVQVVMNLVTNAVKYSPERTEIIIETADHGDHARVCVTDKGMGIPPEEQRFVFERYYRTGNSLQEKGFGLGLFICSEIIRQHRGSIGLKSGPGEGSSFYFTLPYG